MNGIILCAAISILTEVPEVNDSRSSPELVYEIAVVGPDGGIHYTMRLMEVPDVDPDMVMGMVATDGVPDGSEDSILPELVPDDELIESFSIFTLD